MPLQRRLPKRGFFNIFRKKFAIINIKDLKGFEANADLDTNAFKEAGLIKKIGDGVKLLGNGDIDIPLNIKVHKTSKGAKEKIEAAGGKVELI